MIVGIDPGINGGIAWIHDGKVEAVKMPDGVKAQIEFFRGLTFLYKEPTVYLELVGTMPGQSAVAMWTFGTHFGNLEATILSLNLEPHKVRPQAWQKALGLGTKKDHAQPGDNAGKIKTRWKNYLKSVAEKHFGSDTDVSLATADALLILQYGIMAHGPK